MGECHKPPFLLSRPLVSPAPRLTSGGLCSDCLVPAVMNEDNFFKLCPRCYAVLWNRYSQDAGLRRAEEAAKRKAASDEAVRQRAIGQAEKRRARMEKEAER